MHSHNEGWSGLSFVARAQSPFHSLCRVILSSSAASEVEIEQRASAVACLRWVS